MNISKIILAFTAIASLLSAIIFFSYKHLNAGNDPQYLDSIGDPDQLLISSFLEDTDNILSEIGKMPPKETISLLDGNKTTENEEKIFVAMIDNHRAARVNHSGLDHAPIMFEMPAEGGIPRIAAVFTLSQELDKIGPIRSVRPYFLDILKPFNPVIAHAGGSDEALYQLSISKDFLDLDNELGNGAFWRQTNAYAPHNLFTNTINAKQFVEQKNWNYPLQKSVFEFQNAYFEGELVNKIGISFGSTIDYVNWQWNDDLEQYIRNQNSENLEITVANVIIIISKQWSLGNDDKARIGVETTGKGEALVFRNGKMIDCFWEREDGEFFEFSDANEKVVPLSRGKTFFEFIDNRDQINTGE